MAARERHLAWEGCANVRDLGGHPTADGGVTRVRSRCSRRQRPAPLRRGVGAASRVRHRADRRPTLSRRARGRPTGDDSGRGRARSGAARPGVGRLAGDRRGRRRCAGRRRGDAGRLPGVPPPVLRRVRPGCRSGRLGSAGRRARPLHGREGPHGARLRAAAAGRRRLDRARGGRLRAQRAQPAAALAAVVRCGRRRRGAEAPSALGRDPGGGDGGVLVELGSEEEYLRDAGVTSDQLDAVRARLRA